MPDTPQTSVPYSSSMYDPAAGTREASHSGVAWAAIIGGAFAATGLTIILTPLGSAFGLASAAPWIAAPAKALTIASAVWIIVAQWLASAFGGYLTGRLRTKWVGAHTHEVYFRDTVHGFLSWALATVLGALLLVGLASYIGSHAMQAAGETSAGAIGDTASATGSSAATGPYVGSLFRSGPNETAQTQPAPNAATTGSTETPPANGTDTNAAPAAGPNTGANVPATGSTANTGASTAPVAPLSDQDAMETRRILMSAAASGNVSDDDRTYLAGLISARTGLSDADARSRIDQVIGREKADMDAARKAGAQASLYACLALLIGAFIAAAAGGLGGRHRDLHYETGRLDDLS